MSAGERLELAALAVVLLCGSWIVELVAGLI